MKLLVGLGNIGTQFDDTRHNIGFAVLDSLTNGWTEKTKHKALIAEVTLERTKTLLVKPTTYYNQVGEAIQAIKSFYKLQNSDILLIHDELALPFGTVRTRLTGSDAGNNGIKSVITHIGSDVPRVRIGIKNDLAERMDAADFVLAKFSAKERTKLPEVIKTTQKFIKAFVEDSKTFEQTSTKIQ